MREIYITCVGTSASLIAKTLLLNDTAVTNTKLFDCHPLFCLFARWNTYRKYCSQRVLGYDVAKSYTKTHSNVANSTSTQTQVLRPRRCDRLKKKDQAGFVLVATRLRGSMHTLTYRINWRGRLAEHEVIQGRHVLRVAQQVPNNTR